MKTKTPIKVIKTVGRVMTFETNAGRFKALIDHRDKISEQFAFSEDFMKCARAEKAVAVGIMDKNKETCLCLLISGNTVTDECGSVSYVFNIKDKI